jgi:hypothetical protein
MLLTCRLDGCGSADYLQEFSVSIISFRAGQSRLHVIS